MWAGDITSVWTTEGWLSRAVVLALYSHAVIGWALEPQLTRDLTQQTLTMAIRHRTPKAGLLHHSDRGRASMPPWPTSNSLPLAGRQGTAEDEVQSQGSDKIDDDLALGVGQSIIECLAGPHKRLDFFSMKVGSMASCSHALSAHRTRKAPSLLRHLFLCLGQGTRHSIFSSVFIRPFFVNHSMIRRFISVMASSLVAKRSPKGIG